MKDHNDFSGIYREQILELYRNPSNFGELKNFTIEHKSYNSICGDEINVQLKLKKGIIEDASFQGSGCVISIVSSSLLMEKIKGMKIQDVMKLGVKELTKILGIKINPGRMKCMTLPLDSVKGALNKNA